MCVCAHTTVCDVCAHVCACVSCPQHTAADQNTTTHLLPPPPLQIGIDHKLVDVRLEADGHSVCFDG